MISGQIINFEKSSTNYNFQHFLELSLEKYFRNLKGVVSENEFSNCMTHETIIQ